MPTSAIPSQQVTVRVRRLRDDAVLPIYMTEQAAGLDLAASFESPVEAIEIAPRGRVLVGSGIAIELPSGYEAQVRPRSGLALKHGITILNAPGTVDADYRGEIKVLLINQGADPFVVRSGDRIAQLVVAPVSHVALVEVEALGDTARGAGGYGHTGHGTERK